MSAASCTCLTALKEPGACMGGPKVELSQGAAGEEGKEEKLRGGWS